MQGDRNLVVYQGENGQGPAIWASGTNGNVDATLVCQDDGNLVIYDWQGRPNLVYENLRWTAIIEPLPFNGPKHCMTASADKHLVYPGIHSC